MDPYLRNLPTSYGRHLDHHRPLITSDRCRLGRHVHHEHNDSCPTWNGYPTHSPNHCPEEGR